MSNTRKWGGWAIRAVFLALVVALLALTSAAQNSSTTTTPKKTAKKPAATQAAPASTSATSMGQKVFIDPKTHQPFQPSQEDIQALENAGPKTMLVRTQPKQFIGPRGGVAVKLDDSFMSYEVASKGPDGKVTAACVEGESKAQQAVKSGKVVTHKTTTKEALDEK